MPKRKLKFDNYNTRFLGNNVGKHESGLTKKPKGLIRTLLDVLLTTEQFEVEFRKGIGKGDLPLINFNNHNYQFININYVLGKTSKNAT